MDSGEIPPEAEPIIAFLETEVQNLVESMTLSCEYMGARDEEGTQVGVVAVPGAAVGHGGGQEQVRVATRSPGGAAASAGATAGEDDEAESATTTAADNDGKEFEI